MVLDRVERWKGTDQAQYLRPQTIFGSKFEAYLEASKLEAVATHRNYVRPEDRPGYWYNSDSSKKEPADSRPQLQHVEER